MIFSSKVAVERRREVLGVLMLGVTALLFLALATDGYRGDNHRSMTSPEEVSNVLGEPGAIASGFLYILLGHAAHVIYLLTFIWALMLVRHRPIDRILTRTVGAVMLTCSVAGLVQLDFGSEELRLYPGGAMGAFVAHVLSPTFGFVGTNVITITCAVVGLLLATEFLIVQGLHAVFYGVVLAVQSLRELYRALQHRREVARERRVVEDARDWDRQRELEDLREESREVLRRLPEAKRVPPKLPVLASEPEDLNRIKVRPITPPVTRELPFADVPDADETARAERPAQVRQEEKRPDVAAQTANRTSAEPPALAAATLLSPRAIRRKTVIEELPADYEYPKKYTKPSLDLFERADLVAHPNLKESLQQTGVLLEETLKTFGIEARVTDVTRGPTITRFELEPAPGVKVSRFIALADDLALALKAHRVRVEAPIPGKGRVGIEVPNEDRDSVVLRDLLESRVYRRDEGVLSLPLGKDIAGDVQVADLATMPHLLVAGATGAGKTVCVKSILASLLCAKSPDEMQFILIDPKMVELSIFNDIPHLITPVVIDPKKAANSLSWLINEMEERYRLFASLRVRNIEIYNESVENGEIELSESGGESLSVIRKLPYIVCVIDELADLMMLARAEVEDAIARLAQLARAVGIHLIIATQRPSVDVLTGVIKANFPARISFQVSSRVDSRCILDEIGAERLIGRGDLLYLPAGQSKPTRIQGAFVSDDEMNRLIAYLKTQAPPQYRDEIERFGKQQAGMELPDDEEDELLEDAVRVVVETGQASISMVQRRLRVGYTRAARLIDMMERRGIVGPHVGSKAREILVPTLQNAEEVA